MRVKSFVSLAWPRWRGCGLVGWRLGDIAGAGRRFLYLLLRLFGALLLVLQLRSRVRIRLWRRNFTRSWLRIGRLRQAVLALIFRQGLQAGIHFFAELVVHLL
jgi:hypothetical protein